MPVPNIHFIGIYRSKTKGTISQLIHALTHRNNSVLIESTIPTLGLLGDFNIDIISGEYRTKGSNERSYNRQRIHSVS